MKDADFDYPDMLKKPPLAPACKTPQNIVGPFIGILKHHFELSQKAKSAEDFERLMKKFTEAERKRIAEIYKGLRENGYHPVGVDAVGRLVLRVMTGNCHYEFKNLEPGGKLTREMIRRFRLSLERKGVIKQMPAVSPQDIKHEM